MHFIGCSEQAKSVITQGLVLFAPSCCDNRGVNIDPDVFQHASGTPSIAWLKLNVAPYRFTSKEPLQKPAAMVRIYFLQHWFNLSGPVVEKALYDSAAMRGFVTIDLGREPVPDETTVCRFRHLLEAHDLGRRLFDEVQSIIARRGWAFATAATDVPRRPAFARSMRASSTLDRPVNTLWGSYCGSGENPFATPAWRSAVPSLCLMGFRKLSGVWGLTSTRSISCPTSRLKGWNCSFAGSGRTWLKSCALRSMWLAPIRRG